jgi:hypothetical protein
MDSKAGDANVPGWCWDAPCILAVLWRRAGEPGLYKEMIWY